MSADTAASARAVLRRLRNALPPMRAALVPLLVDGAVAGQLTPERARRAAGFDRIFVSDGVALRFAPALADAGARSVAMAEVARTLAGEGALSPWRDERYRVAPAADVLPWFELERAAARYFGIRTHAAHVNGLVRGRDGMTMWIARRSPDKALDPGMLDNLVGGGVAGALSVRDTVVKESWEEAGIPPALAALASPTGMLRVTRLLPDGLQDESLHVHDLVLPEGFVPRNQDGEAGEHRRLCLADIAAILARDTGPGAMTVDASLVALTALLREGTLRHDDADAVAGLHALAEGLARAATAG